MRTLRKVAPKTPAGRGGATLTEVLMAILCMGIGVVAVASLFPIALLRSVQATQLTSGTILRFNAETLIDLYNELPPFGSRNLIYNPDFADPDANGNPFDEHFNTTYLVDPYGAMLRRDEKALPLDQTNAMAGQVDLVGDMLRHDALRIFYQTPSYGNNITQAIREGADVVTMPDSWTVMYDFIAATNTSDTVTLEDPIPADVTTAINDGLTLRLVLFSSDGKTSATRLLTDPTQINGADVGWPVTGTNAQPALPARYFPDGVSRVRIEVRERRYSWMLTVRNFTANPTVPQALVDVVIFFRRSPSEEDEMPYTLTGTGRNYTVTKINATDPDPFLKKGGYMLDTTSGTWHRMSQVNDDTLAITLERNVTSTIPDTNKVVFMRGVIEVYRLGIK